MPETPESRIYDELDRIDVEAPGDTQATHAYHGETSVPAGTDAQEQLSRRDRVADRVDRVGDALERRALELELQGGIKAKAAPAVRRVSRAADVSAAYVRENDIEDMRADLETSIREHPLRSMVLALGAGYLLARILD
jgi:hypothetical protein